MNGPNFHQPEEHNRSKKKAPREDLLMASDAIKELGIPKSTFQRLVKAKKIPKETPFGRTEGYYPKKFIFTLASHLKGETSYNEVLALLEQMTQKQPEQSGATDWIQPGDLPYVLALDYEMYGITDVVDLATTSKWWEKNPYQCRILFDKSDRTKIWGALSIMPLPFPIISQLLNHQMSEREISPDDILLFESGKVYDGYVASAVIRPEHRSYFRMLIQSVLTFWCEQYPSIRLRYLYADVTSDGGVDLIKHLFFSPLANSSNDFGDSAFVLDLYQRNPSRLIQQFQHCIQTKQ